jgi:hypothetical protein
LAIADLKPMQTGAFMSNINARFLLHTDWMQIAGFSDEYPAGVVKQNTLAKHKKALVIYGTGHVGEPIESMNQLKREQKIWKRSLAFRSPFN